MLPAAFLLHDADVVGGQAHHASMLQGAGYAAAKQWFGYHA
jgi:D-aminopeptidase